MTASIQLAYAALHMIKGLSILANWMDEGKELSILKREPLNNG
jgi:hypothetical protein